LIEYAVDDLIDLIALSSASLRENSQRVGIIVVTFTESVDFMFIDNLNYISSNSALYRKQFGTLNGLFLWLKFRRDYKLPHGSIYKTKIPSPSTTINLRAGTSDLMVFKQVICSGETDFKLPFRPRFIIDAGANIGFSSIIFASKYPDCKIIALEVETTNYELLCMNTANYPNIKPVKKALWGHDCHVKISNPLAEPWAFQVIETNSDDPESIEAISIETLLNEYEQSELSLLKVDIEGSEVDLLRDTPKWLEHTRAIAIELHDRIRPGCTEAFEHLLSGRHYTEFQQGEYRIVYF